MGSGKGTNCYSLLDAFASGLLNTTEIIGVFSDNPNSGILDIAKGAKIPGLYLGPYDRLNAEKDKSWIDEIKNLNPDLIVLAGFMRVLSKQFIEAFDSRIINLHPSLLPCFRGLNAIKQAWDAGVKITGCTVHWVSPDLDCGEIIAQAPVRVMTSDAFTFSGCRNLPRHETL
jgi:phosphoribosylglycinamide formyltransferase-1